MQKAGASRLTIEAIVSAAFEVLEERGADAFGMRAVADRLGTGAASLYRHVPNKEALFELLVNDALAAVPEPDPARPWRARLTELALDVRTALSSRRDLARIAMTARSDSGPSLRIAESVLAALAEAGASPWLASIMLDRISLYVLADAFSNALYADRFRAVDPAAYWQSLAGGYAGLDAKAYPQLASHAGELTRADPQERFLVGLEALIDGAEAVFSRG